MLKFCIKSRDIIIIQIIYDKVLKIGCYLVFKTKKRRVQPGHVRLIFDERAVAVVFVRKQMGTMRKTELAGHPFNGDL